MNYDLEDLKTLAMYWDDDEDVEDLLLLKYLGREEDLARAALRHRMHVFDFESLKCKDFKNKFRFQKKDVPTLCRLLEITDTMVGDNGMTWSGLEGLSILLRRLRFSGCLYDMDALFNRGEATISIIFNSMLRLLYGTWNGLLVNLRENTGPGRWVTHAKLIEASTAVGYIGPFQHVCGFIDSMCRPIARPSRHQRIW